MNEHSLVNLIRQAVVPLPKPCVNISGGIDSTVILHHLDEKSREPIYTYTVGFSDQETEFAYAAEVADHYGTFHTEILIDNMLKEYPKILKHFPQPRYNLWPYWLAKQAHKDKRQNCYIGEGGDEHFGGYWYKPKKTYIENWQGFFEYVYPTYKTIYDIFKINLNVPMHPNSLDWTKTIRYHDYGREKQFLREAYKGIMPDFVVNRRKKNGRKSYEAIWEKELKQYFPKAHPTTEEEVKRLWQMWVTREWLKIHGSPEIQTNEAILIR